jgi:hypothetical protein
MPVSEKPTSQALATQIAPERHRELAQQCMALVVIRGESSEAVALQGDGAADRGAAVAGRVADQERQRIERSEVIQSGQVSAVRPVGGEKQTKQVSETAKRAAMRPEAGYVDPSLRCKGGLRMLVGEGRVDNGNSGAYSHQLRSNADEVAGDQ